MDLMSIQGVFGDERKNSRFRYRGSAERIWWCYDDFICPLNIHPCLNKGNFMDFSIPFFGASVHAK